MKTIANFLAVEQRQELASRHRLEPSKRYADRIKIILALDKGLSFAEAAELFLLSDDALRSHYATFINCGIEALLANNYHGYDGKLSADAKQQLREWVNQNLLSSVQPAIDWCREKFDAEFSISGMRDLLHRLDFVYKHTVLVPGNADPQAQREFVEKITDLLAHKAPETPVIYLDAVHPTHNPRPTKVWGLRGEKIAVPANTGYASASNE
ncbi:hypothetical protein FACS1894107_08730 [Planctomycetales bacterium]|nr:hypothetical protein FACS1894107_08730 [Planctomycetales bacterium]